MPKSISAALVAVVVAVLAAAGTVTAQTVQRFSDVPPDHEAFAAVEWAAEVGVTAGYGDGTFRPAVPLPKRHAVVFMERYYDEILGADESEDFTRGDMMALLHEMSGAIGDQSAATDDLLGSAYAPVGGVPDTSIWGVDIERPRPGGVLWTRFEFRSVSAHSNRDLAKWPVRGSMTLLCSTDPRQNTPGPWLVSVNIQGDAKLPAHYEGLNVSLDNGPEHGIATTKHGLSHGTWAVAQADAFMAWIADGASLSVTTLFEGEGVTFDVSELRLFTTLVPERCRW